MKSSGVEDKNQFIPNPYPKKQRVIRRPSPMDHSIRKEAFQINRNFGHKVSNVDSGTNFAV